MKLKKKLNTLKLISEDKKHYFAFESKQFLNQGRFIEAYVSGKINQKR